MKEVEEIYQPWTQPPTQPPVQTKAKWTSQCAWTAPDPLTRTTRPQYGAKNQPQSSQPKKRFASHLVKPRGIQTGFTKDVALIAPTAVKSSPPPSTFYSFPPHNNNNKNVHKEMNCRKKAMSCKPTSKRPNMWCDRRKGIPTNVCKPARFFSLKPHKWTQGNCCECDDSCPGLPLSLSLSLSLFHVATSSSFVYIFPFYN